jgi:hypothetical protein
MFSIKSIEMEKIKNRLQIELVWLKKINIVIKISQRRDDTRDTGTTLVGLKYFVYDDEVIVDEVTVELMK